MRINGNPVIYAIVESMSVDSEENVVINWDGDIIGEFSPVAQHMSVGEIVAQETVLIAKNMCKEGGYTPADTRDVYATIIRRLQVEMEGL